MQATARGLCCWRGGLAWAGVRRCSSAGEGAAKREGRARKRLPKGHWKERENCVRFLEQLAAEHGIEQDGDWARVTSRHVERAGGGGLLRAHANSLARALEAAYPGRSFAAVGPAPAAASPAVQGGRASRWGEAAERRRFLEEAAQTLGVERPEDWRGVTRAHLAELGGGGLLRRFGGSVLEALRDAYPEYAEAPATLLRKSVGRSHWERREARAALLQEVRREQRIERPEQWAHAGPAIRAKGGARLLERYASLAALLQDTFPDEEVPAGLVLQGRLPNGHWDSWQHRRRFMDEVAARYGVESAADWKRVGTREVEAVRGGSAVLRRYGSIYAALIDLYPEQEELASIHTVRKVVPHHHWKSQENVRRFMDFAAAELRVQQAEDWYRVGREQVRSLPGGGVISTIPLPELLRIAYPTVSWDAAQFSGSAKRSTQRLLLTHISRMFPQPRLESVA